MLTFRFTGVRGEMIEKEMLVSGMVGKQVKFEFSEEWDGLRKAAVYRAGDIVCTNPDIGEIDTIPEQVLSKSLRRLYVGVYGISEDGQVAIPTRFVSGPFIHIGAGKDEDSKYDPEDPFWVEMEQALEETVRFTPQALTAEQKAQARANIGVAGGGGMNAEAAALLLQILQKAVFTEEVSQLLAELEEAMQEDDTTQTPEDPETPETPEDPEDPDTPGTTYYTVSCSLDHVTANPASAVVAAGKSHYVMLIAEEGYVLDTVSVIMGGVDITASTHSGNFVTIGAVTGNVLITAKAVAEETSTIHYLPGTIHADMLNRYEYPSARMSVMTTEAVADTPFPQNGNQGLGDLYLLPVPAGANVLAVTSPGLVGGPQFFNLADGVYTCALDTGWLTENAFRYTFTADAYGFVGINFKKSDGSQFFTEDYDTSGMVVEFATEEVTEPEEPEAVEVSVTLSLTNAYTNNQQKTAVVGQAYNTLVTAAEGYVLETVQVLMGGVDVTGDVYSVGAIRIPSVTGELVITVVAVEDLRGIVFIPASLSAGYLNRYEYPSHRISAVTREVVADTPFPQNGNFGLGDLYLIPVPADATVLNVVSPGLVGGPQFFTLADGVYSCELDMGWQTLDGFSYTFGAGTYGFVGINFKNSAGSTFYTEEYDTSGIEITFQ